MSKNIEMNVLDSNGNYESLYPSTNWELIKDKPVLVTSYNQLTDKPNIPVMPDLPLSIVNGGTGTSSLSSLKSSLNYGLELSSKNFEYVGNGANLNWIETSEVDFTPSATNYLIGLTVETMGAISVFGTTTYPVANVWFGGSMQVNFQVKAQNYTTEQPFYFNVAGKANVGAVTIAKNQNQVWTLRCMGGFNISGATYLVALHYLKIV